MGHNQTNILYARRPWNTMPAEADLRRARAQAENPERQRRDIHIYDSPEQIEMCLNCKLASCKNCVDVSSTMHKALSSGLEKDELEPVPVAAKKRPVGRPKGQSKGAKTIKGQIRELMAQGYDERKIALKLNADRTGVRNIMLKIMKEEEDDGAGV